MDKREEFRALAHKNGGTYNLMGKIFLSLGLLFIVLIVFIGCVLLVFRPEELQRYMQDPMVIGMTIFSVASIVLGGFTVLYKKRKNIK